MTNKKPRQIVCPEEGYCNTKGRFQAFLQPLLYKQPKNSLSIWCRTKRLLFGGGGDGGGGVYTILNSLPFSS